MGQEEELPRLERGRDLSRIFAFTDGVFAIAITLLVLQIEVPSGVTGDSSLWSALGDELPDFTAFAISFIVIGMYWISNHRFMRTVVEFDRGLMLLTMLYLAFVVLIPFSSQLMGEYGDVAALSVLLYTANLLAGALTAAAMQRHVLSAKLGKPEYDWDTELTLKSSLFTSAVFVASIPFAFLLGPYTPLLWLLLRFDPYERRRNSIYDEREAVKPTVTS